MAQSTIRAARPSGAVLRVMRGCSAAILTLLWTGAATAVPVDVFFRGNSPPTDPGTNFGLGEAQALMLRDDFGLEILDQATSGFSFVGSAMGILDVVDQRLEFEEVNPPSGPSRARSRWTLENISGNEIAGASYLLFTHTDVFSEAGVEIDYLDDNVGMTVDADLGWVIVKSTDSILGSFYYPAIPLDRGAVDPLDGVVGVGILPAPVRVSYVLQDEPLREAPPGSMAYQLPELEIGFGFRPVPEPGTASLVAVGLLQMAIRRRGPKSSSASTPRR